MAGEEDAAEDGGGWDVGDELELPTDLVSHTYIITVYLIVLCHAAYSIISLTL